MLLSRVLIMVITAVLIVGLVGCFTIRNIAINDMEEKVILQNQAYGQVLESALDRYKLSVQAIANDSRIMDSSLSVANRNKSNTVSGRITIRADISRLSNVRILLFYIDMIG